MKNLLRKRKILLLLWLTLSGALTLYGQSRTFSGVVNSPDGDPLAGAIVIVMPSGAGSATDSNGHFSVTLDNSAENIAISYLGMKSLTLPVSSLPQPFVVTLEAEANTIDDILVVGYGVQRKASSVASITQTKREDLQKGGTVNSVSEAIQGRLNGVIAINSNAKPGANTANIYIRGKSSWTSTTPLVLVDGVERDFNDVDFDQVESISVLKDASATAVYGTRGGNGVILLTTRRGSEAPPQVTFNGSFGFKQPTQRFEWPDYLYSMNVWNEAATNDMSWNSIIPQSTITAWENAYATGNYGPYNEMFPQIDWYDAVMRDFGTTQQYNVTVDGGNNVMKYFASVGYHRDGDIFNLKKQPDYDPRSNFERYNWRLNLDFNITPSTTLSANISGKIGYRQEKVSGDDATYTVIMRSPTNEFPLKHDNGYWGDTASGGYNILANMYGQGELSEKSSQNWYDFILKQDLGMLLKGLSVTGKVSYNSYIDTRSVKRKGKILGENDYNAGLSVIRYYKRFDYTQPVVGPDGSITYPLVEEKRLPGENTMDDLPLNSVYDNLRNFGDQQYYEFAVNYANSFGDHNVTALALVNRTVKKFTNNANLQFPSYREDWVGRITYNYKERYLAEFNISYTGSENFAPANRFGLFPSMSVGWRISEEPFVKRLTSGKLNNLKLRYSYGQVGSDVGSGSRFKYIQTYSSAGGVVYGDGTGVNTGNRYTEGNLADPYSGWETATKQNLGLEIGLWNKLNISVDLFDEKREGILMSPRNFPFWLAATPGDRNLGKTKNHGFEIEAHWNDKIGTDWNYSIGFNMAMSENRVVFRDDPTDFADYQKDAGKPIDAQKRLIAIGNYQTIDDIYNAAATNLTTINKIVPGDLVYVDYNGDGIIDNAGDSVVSDKLNYPLATYTANLGVGWKGLRLSAMFYAPIGQHKIYPGVLYFDFPEGQKKAQPLSVERWTPETANTSGVRRPATHLRENRTHNDTNNTLRYIDYSYLRLKTVELSYEFPKKWLSRANISGCRLYVNGNNLWTLSDIDPGMDPETNDVNAYPIVKTYTVGARISF
jgi:TonB-linked SusC/RagA family outer membrane protein